MVKKFISVVLCTRNPRREFISECLSAIESQVLPGRNWEVVLLDNGSSPGVGSLGLKFPENLNLVSHSIPGFNSARRAGVSAAEGEWIVYVDDDNILHANYLEEARRAIESHPSLDVFCGQIHGRFEAPPPVWLQPFLGSLAIKEFSEEMIGSGALKPWMPTWTAGMVARRSVVMSYFDVVAKDPFRQALLRCEDYDFVSWALEKGCSLGKVPSLQMEHIIPASRLDPQYMRKLLYEQGLMLGSIAARDIGSRKGLFAERLRAIRNVVRSYGNAETNSRKLEIAASTGYLLGLLNKPKKVMS